MNKVHKIIEGELLFKFMRFDTAIKVILNQELLFSNPKTFNDPFDCDLNLIYCDLADCGDEIKNEIELLKAQLSVNLGTHMPKSFIYSQIDQYCADGSLEKIYLQGQQNKIENNAVCCFSLDYKNVCMWSHYADNHRGVCLAFENKVESPFLNIDNEDISYGIVQYQNYEPFNYLKNKRLGMERLLLTKSPDWEYEKEFRYISPFGSKLEKFYPNFLKGIIFGSKTSSDQQESLIKLCEFVCKTDFWIDRMQKEKLNLKIEFLKK